MNQKTIERWHFSRGRCTRYVGCTTDAHHLSKLLLEHHPFSAMPHSMSTTIRASHKLVIRNPTHDREWDSQGTSVKRNLLMSCSATDCWHNTKLSVVMQFIPKSNVVCVGKQRTCEEKAGKRAADACWFHQVEKIL